ncbi:MAG TPA: hypothetical protein VHW71_04380 [Steroidobacteraceae bacterium]|jgi:ribosomal protein L40E|nr:hypothetical protein [Steroidobacteraceae bacterium]
MSLLDPPHCPNCNSVVDLRELWKAAPKGNRGSQIDGSVGIVCPDCGIKLRVLQARIQIVGLLMFALFGFSVLAIRVVPFNTSMVSARLALVIVATLYFGGFLLWRRLKPKFLRVRLLKDNEEVIYPLIDGKKEKEIRDKEMAESLDLESSDESRPVWICPKCGAENPGNFDECWKCQTWRMGTQQSADPPAAAE